MKWDINTEKNYRWKGNKKITSKVEEKRFTELLEGCGTPAQAHSICHILELEIEATHSKDRERERERDLFFSFLLKHCYFSHFVHYVSMHR